MLLKLVDRLVKQGNYAEALRILARASEEDPKNPYVRAYEARIRVLMDQPGPAPAEPSASGRPQGAVRPPAPLPPTMSADQRRVALLSKVAAILSKANEHLSTGDFQRAIEEVGRARMLDEHNPDIKGLEQRIRDAQQDAERFAETERQRLAREQEEAHRREMDDLRRDEERRRAQEAQARRAAHEQKLNESLSRCRTLLAAGRLKESQNELAFALVLDPDSRAGRQLEQEIARAHEQALRAELQRKKQEEEARARAAEDLRAKIQAAVGQAHAAAARGEFAEALDAITRAYVLDPTSSLLQEAESQIAAAREVAIRQEREDHLARQREEEHRQIEAQRRKTDDERQALLRHREAEEEKRRNAAHVEIEKHLDRARGFLSRGQFDAALSEVALAFVADPFDEQTRALEQEILRAQEAAAEAPTPTDGAASADEDDTPPAIAVHIESAREHAAGRDFAKAFDSIARAYAVDPLHPAVQECERIIQAAFIEYQASLAHTAGPRRGADGSPSASSRARLMGANRGVAVTTSVLTFDDTSVSGTAAVHPPPEPADRLVNALPWYRHRPVMYVGGVGAMLVVAAVFLISSPSGKMPESPAPATQDSSVDGQARAQEPPSAPVTLSEPQILPGDKSPASGAKPAATPAKLRRDETEPDLTIEEGNQQAGALPADQGTSTDQPAGGDQTTAEAPAEPPVSLSKVDVSTPALPQRQNATPAPGPAHAPKAPEIRRLQQPRIPDAILKSGIRGEVAVLVEIDGEGKPVSARVTRSTIPVLNELFVEAVMASEFSPGVSADGRTSTTLTIPFRVGD